MENEKSIVYHHDVVEFVTVAVEYCVFLESAVEKEKQIFTDSLLKLLPLLYLKATLMPKLAVMSDSPQETFVTEENYEIVRHNISMLMGGDDDYLDVFVEDMKYSDSPILKTISEDLADIYQQVKDFVCAYRVGNEEKQQDAIAILKEEFENYWGQRLVSVMRPLHDLKYGIRDEEEY